MPLFFYLTVLAIWFYWLKLFMTESVLFHVVNKRGICNKSNRTSIKVKNPLDPRLKNQVIPKDVLRSGVS